VVSVKWAKIQEACVWSFSAQGTALWPMQPFGALNCSHKTRVALLSRFVLKQAWKQNSTFLYAKNLIVNLLIDLLIPSSTECSLPENLSEKLLEAEELCQQATWISYWVKSSKMWEKMGTL
jgi:hypothetical protein